MAVLKHIGVLSAAKVSALMGALLGLITALLAIIKLTFLPTRFNTSGIFTSMEFMLVLFIPIIYGFLGLFFGLIGAAIYNLVAKWVGGLELEFTQ